MTWPEHKPPGGPGKGPRSDAPARRYSRPPFPPGNALGTSHGARSPRVYGELARHLAAGLTEDRPDLGHYPEAVAAWATAEAQAALLRRHVAEVGPLDPDTGQPRDSLLTWLNRTESAAARHRATLGLDPRSEAALSRERAAASVLAVDLDALAERGRAALAARSTVPPDLAGEVLAVAQAEGASAWAEAGARHNGAER